MLVFIDESGDPGFQLDRDSSPIFALAMVVFSDAEEAQRAGVEFIEENGGGRGRPTTGADESMAIHNGS